MNVQLSKELSLGQRVYVQGFVMLKGLEDGQTYEVIRVVKGEHPYNKTEVIKEYWLKRVLKNKKLSRKTVGHLSKDIHLWLNNLNNQNMIFSL